MDFDFESQTNVKKQYSNMLLYMYRSKTKKTPISDDQIKYATLLMYGRLNPAKNVQPRLTLKFVSNLLNVHSYKLKYALSKTHS